MRRLPAALLGAAAGAIVSAVGTRIGIAGDPARWRRNNHAGRPVTLTEGPAAAVGAVAGSVITELLDGAPGSSRTAWAATVAIGGAAAVGAYDDLLGSTQAKGFRGHLGALRKGVITSGMIKIVGVGAAASAAGVILPGRRAGAGRKVADVIINTTLTAGSANLINLLDLRPGRAAKMIIGLGVPAGAWPIAGAAAGVITDDLAGRSMLGDCGANALGAGLAVSAARLPLPVRLAALAGVVGLNLASERVSFTAVIADNPVLDALDRWGRGGSGPSTGSGPVVDG
ncbi:hypothetical protein [Microlunatus soli]|uniref:UDP-N-acetylmuramyl pentapeptide phosphotransferase/UDP-N-acetylglucosamine-1-phosphate transferase n=1 Tax=Microlunatus soli TaxID=630515 RepID=A0A1H1XZ59_9ACTN|nr:hypothetical protein [Microlunatus soli]SDT14473.1 UDP-N-acetylmuramyl pentapeptide phosphotransferase/UDP-N-acetylglucosamine-1-phosphate transferase [Microlunatus soli]